jgi:poly-beta-1,6-N-acetyl-D-glucosamine synthase
MELLGGYVFYYPIVMSMFWMIGGLYYYARRERGSRRFDDPPPLQETPFVTILIPCRNEGAHIDETIEAAAAQAYPHFEIIAINDGSTDDTAERLGVLVERYPQLRVIHLDTNQGKANALRMGAVAARSEYLVCIDGDALLEENAVHWMMSQLTSGPRVGAVTGNPRIRNRSTLLGRLQVGEFSSIIGMIKRAQRVYGRVFTVSGVICAFRRTALQRVGFWSDNIVTEDIDISWRLQLDHWDIRYEPNALCYILMPETLPGLWMQRLRWAKGGIQTLLRHGSSLLHWNNRRMWGVLTEFMLSAIWAYTVVLLALMIAIDRFTPIELSPQFGLTLGWHGVVMALVCLMQFAISLRIDRRYEQGIGRYYYWMVWYPAAFWLLTMTTSVVANTRMLFSRGQRKAVWVSPDRGYR